MLNYKAIDILTSESARHRNKPVVDAVLQYIRDLKIAARCMVTRGIAGCYESGEIATRKLQILSLNLPIRIYIVLPAAEVDRVISGLDEIVSDGILAMHDIQVVGHRARNAFFPRQIKVRDVMTPNPTCLDATSPLNEAARLLLSSIFTGLPVVDPSGKVNGVITQGDLISRGGMPLRLGLLAESDTERLDSVLQQLAGKRVTDAMTSPVITIEADHQLADAVDLMLSKGIKRLPVTDSAGVLVGMLSRLDIFKTVMRESPDWNSFKAQKIEVKRLRVVGDILRRDTHTVTPDTALEAVIRVIDQNDIQRVAVVGNDETLLGLISDKDLLHYFKQRQDGFWNLFEKASHPFRKDVCQGDLRECLATTTAAAVMNTDLITVKETMLIEEAIGLMTQKALKRLPVIDDAGRFKGMISRDSLLRTGFGGAA